MRILLVEDEEYMAQAVAQVLEKKQLYRRSGTRR